LEQGEFLPAVRGAALTLRREGGNIGASAALFRQSQNEEIPMIRKLLFAVGIGYLFRRFTGSRSRGTARPGARF
jgi:hypothetical protein